MIDYEKEYKKKLEENIKNVVEEIDSSDMQVKINNWADKYGEDPEKVKQKIIEDEMFRKQFAKEPSKQNFYQNEAAKYIKNIEGVENFEVLPQSGSKAKYVCNGNLFEGKDLETKNQSSKSIDFYWKFNNKEYYASHKYIKEEGGAQDNQYQDVQNFLKDSRDNNSENKVFISICDGNYFQNKDNKTGDETRMKRLDRLANNKNTFATDICGLENIFKKLDE